MRILLTNDDGINAPGIRALVEQLSQNHDIYICAPENQMSGASHYATYFKGDLKIKKYDIKGVKKAYSTYGTPVDCAYVGLKYLFKDKIDLVISGINQGWNVSIDTYFSGTVGAAREALFLGTPAMATSLNSYTIPEFEVAAKIVEDLIPKYLSDPNKDKYVFSVNIPLLKQEEIKGYMVVGSEPDYKYNDNFSLDKISDGYILHAIETKPHKVSEQTIKGDASACEKGYVAITPLSLVQDDKERFDYLKEILK